MASSPCANSKQTFYKSETWLRLKGAQLLKRIFFFDAYNTMQLNICVFNLKKKLTLED